MNKAEELIKSFGKLPWVYLNQKTLISESSERCHIRLAQRLRHKKKKSEVSPVTAQIFIFPDGSVISNFDYLTSTAVPPEVSLANAEKRTAKYAKKAEYIDMAYAYTSLQSFSKEQRLILLDREKIEQFARINLDIHSFTGHKRKRTISTSINAIKKASAGTIMGNLVLHPYDLKTILEAKLTKEKWAEVDQNEIAEFLKPLNDWLKEERYEFHLAYNPHSGFITALTSPKCEH
ncbi:hypothetical protein [Vibrio owensii]|uniref:hypothetical protein n=1 Tax=Vibrio owensii TaxID=696485 RepID=UPI0018F190C6|nr:hypothetical protein [Vibrio owensii]